MAHLWPWFVTAVWPNLVASMIWGTPAGAAFVWHHRRLKAHHRAELQKVRDQHAEDLRQTRVHLLDALAEVRNHLLGAIADERRRQGGDR